MDNLQTQQEKVDKTPEKTDPPQSSSQNTTIYCILCRKLYLKHEAQEHMHSMLHHRELETVLGRDAFHECQACSTSGMGLNVYAQHISTAQHKANLKSLMSRNVKPVPLDKTLSCEIITMILKRNKHLKYVRKKAMRKEKQKLKQAAGWQHTEMQQKTTVAPKAPKVEKSKQVQMETWKQMQGNPLRGSSSAVVQNKENKASGLQRPLHHTESAPQGQSRRLVYWSGELSGQTWHQDQFTQSIHCLSFNEYASVNNQCGKIANLQTDRPQMSQGDVTGGSELITQPDINQYSHGYRQNNRASDQDFTSDHLPQSGAIVFGHEQGQGSVNKSASTPPPQASDVSSMLRQIRRALSVREPYRADREAQKQNSTASVRAVDGSTAQISINEMRQPAGTSSSDHITSAPTTSVPPPQVSTSAPAAHAGVSPSSGNSSRKVRIAHKPSRAHEDKEARLKPTLNKLLSASVSRRKATWREMYDEGKKKIRGMPRFGIELAPHPSSQQDSIQPEDRDPPLSEGFHWESFPGTPLDPFLMLPPPAQDSADADDHMETRSESQAQDGSEQPGAEQESCSSQTAAGVSVKMEAALEDKKGESADSSRFSKRKRNTVTDDGISDTMSSGKKKKKKKSNKVSPSLTPDQDQMDQLLTVSLREEELSKSLQDLDESLIQARTALQAAYAEVQRLMLLKQQFIFEVDRLRAQRIEILQEMQEGYSAASNASEPASTSSAGAADPGPSPSLPSSTVIPTSSGQPTPATTPAPSIAQIHPTPLALSIKREMCHLDTAGQPSHNPDAPPQFPSLLSRPSHTASPSAACAQQPPAGCSTSVSTPHALESSTRKQEEETGEVLEDRGQTALAEESQPAEEETGGNLSTGQPGGKGPTAGKSVPEKEKCRNDEGNKSGEMIHLSNKEVIAIEESDCEDSPRTDSNVRAPPEPPQQPVSVELSSDRKLHPPAVSVKSEISPAESAEDEEPSVGTFLHHAGPVHGMQVHDGLLYTCSGDNTARACSLVTRECKAVFEGHTNKINCLLVSSLPNMPPRLYTGSSDQTIRIYSLKPKKCLDQISLTDSVLCLHVAWNILYAGLANGSVASYDLKTLKELDVFECHGPRGVSCLGTAQEGARRLLLVGSCDSTISVRDAKSGLLLRSLKGHTKTVLCMKVANDLVFSGSSDTSVYAHNIHTGMLVRTYMGHSRAVTSIVILGKTMVTACLDKLVRVYELQSHDPLQVYGGHSDMAMCMAVHKSVIYTGCYDGSVQAVKLDLMKNYRCWWQNCSLIFGKPDHLAQHLTGDHSNPKLQTVKCRWRGCDMFFASQQSISQKLPEHMQNHVDKDSSVER